MYMTSVAFRLDLCRLYRVTACLVEVTGRVRPRQCSREDNNTTLTFDYGNDHNHDDDDGEDDDDDQKKQLWQR